MLSKVEVRNRRGESLVLPLGNFENGFGLAGVEGLGPTKATLVSSGFAGQDGAQYYSSKRESRVLKILLDIIPDFVETSARSLRQELYRYLMPKTEVTVRLHDELGSYVDIVGRVESLEADIFTSDPVAEATLMCFDPDFFDPNPYTSSGLTVTGSDTTMKTVSYLGSVESGMLFTMNLDRPLSSFSIVHETPGGQTYTLDFANPLLAGDKLVISTIAGAKGVSLVRNNVTSSMLWALSPRSKWLELEGPGDNKIRVSASAAGVPWNIQYVNRHGGM